MPQQRRPTRGLADLRTLTACWDTPISPYKAYLRLSFLELERARRMQEVRACNDRCDTIRDRFDEIDAKVAHIRAGLDAAAPPARAVEAPPRSPVGRRPATRHFQLNY